MHRTTGNRPWHHEELEPSRPYGGVILHQLSSHIRICVQKGQPPVMGISEWTCRQKMARVMQVRQMGHMGVLDLVDRTIAFGAIVARLNENHERESIKCHAKL